MYDILQEYVILRKFRPHYMYKVYAGAIVEYFQRRGDEFNKVRKVLGLLAEN